MILFSEDRLLEIAIRKIISVKNPAIAITGLMGNRGYDFFSHRLPEIRRSAQGVRFIIALDGDRLGDRCPGVEIQSWFGNPPNPNICVRFACREVENWFLADKDNIANFLRISAAAIPTVDDSTPDAKELLVRLAGRSRDRAIQSEFLPQRGQTATIGPGYVSRLLEFAQIHWDIDAASENSDSLNRACAAIASLTAD